MAKRLFKRFLPFMILSSLVVVNTSCTYFSPIVGKWRDNSTGYIMEFTRDGKVIINADNYVITGTYQLVSGDVVNLSLEGDAGNLMGLMGSNSFQYTISGNAMTITGGGGSGVLYRVVKSTTPKIVRTTTTNSTPTITVTYPKSGQTFRVSQEITITWKTTNLSNTATVTINCNYQNGAGFYVSAFDGVPNTGSFKWTIPSNITLNGSKAQITIANSIGQHLVAEGSSGFFNVTN